MTIWYALENRDRYGQITIVYGARTAGDLVFRDELDAWPEIDGVQVITCVDPGGETPDWTGEVGYVPNVLKEAELPKGDKVALVIGPPVMIRFSLPVLAEAGVRDESIFTSLENRMKCGVGMCGRCNVGRHFVCKDGPVFTLNQLNQMPKEY